MQLRCKIWRIGFDLAERACRDGGRADDGLVTLLQRRAHRFGPALGRLLQTGASHQLQQQLPCDCGCGFRVQGFCDELLNRVVARELRELLLQFLTVFIAQCFRGELFAEKSRQRAAPFRMMSSDPGSGRPHFGIC